MSFWDEWETLLRKKERHVFRELFETLGVWILSQHVHMMCVIKFHMWRMYSLEYVCNAVVLRPINREPEVHVIIAKSIPLSHDPHLLLHHTSLSLTLMLCSPVDGKAFLFLLQLTFLGPQENITLPELFDLSPSLFGRTKILSGNRHRMQKIWSVLRPLFKFCTMNYVGYVGRAKSTQHKTRKSSCVNARGIPPAM